MVQISRAEMKEIMGGVQDPNAFCRDECLNDDDCTDGRKCFLASFPGGGSCNRCVLPEDMLS